MSIAIPKWLVPWLVGVWLTAVAVTLVIAVRAYAHLRRAGYYVLREAARRTFTRSLLVLLILAFLTIGSLLIPRQESTPLPTLTATANQPPTPTPTFVTPTLAATATPTPQPTATEPFIPTSTPQATLPITFTTPLPSAVPPPADARIEFWTLAQGVDENDRPVDPATVFPAGIERVYLFFTYDGLLPNVPVTILWYRNGELLNGGIDLWESERVRGERYVYLVPAGGYTAGRYQVQVWLGDRLQIQVAFSVVEAEG